MLLELGLSQSWNDADGRLRRRCHRILFIKRNQALTQFSNAVPRIRKCLLSSNFIEASDLRVP